MKLVRPLITAVATVVLIGCGSDHDYPDPMKPDSNTPPTASNSEFTTQADTELMGDLMAADDDGDSLTFALVDAPTNGSVTVDETGSFTYLPDATVTGMDRFTFEVSDGEASSGVATVDIVIEPLEVSFSTYSRQAFEQMPTDEPLPVNGRAFNQDVTEPSAYDDLLMP